MGDIGTCGTGGQRGGSGISSGNRHGTSAHSISDYPAFSIPNRR